MGRIRSLKHDGRTLILTTVRMNRAGGNDKKKFQFLLMNKRSYFQERYKVSKMFVSEPEFVPDQNKNLQRKKSEINIRENFQPLSDAFYSRESHSMEDVYRQCYSLSLIKLHTFGEYSVISSWNLKILTLSPTFINGTP